MNEKQQTNLYIHDKILRKNRLGECVIYSIIRDSNRDIAFL